jgi:type IV secretory pathway VirB2 component (pilin)
MFFYNLTAFASSGETGTGLPWEKPIEILKNSLLFLGALLVIIGFIWAGYSFLAQGEKEQGFKRLIGCLIGGSIIFGCKTIVSVMYGASF